MQVLKIIHYYTGLEQSKVYEIHFQIPKTLSLHYIRKIDIPSEERTAKLNGIFEILLSVIDGNNQLHSTITIV